MIAAIVSVLLAVVGTVLAWIVLFRVQFKVPSLHSLAAAGVIYMHWNNALIIVHYIFDQPLMKGTHS
jgi:hypothetical protein